MHSSGPPTRDPPVLTPTPAVWAIICIGLQGEFFEGREPNREANAEELEMLQYNAQACDIIFNGLCPEEFNKISHLENAKEIWDTLIDMHEGTDSVKESKLDVLQSQLDKFKMKDGEGVAEMYSRLVSRPRCDPILKELEGPTKDRSVS